MSCIASIYDKKRASRINNSADSYAGVTELPGDEKHVSLNVGGPILSF